MSNVSSYQDYLEVRQNPEPSVGMVIDRLMDMGWSLEKIQEHMGDIVDALKESYVI